MNAFLIFLLSFFLAWQGLCSSVLAAGTEEAAEENSVMFDGSGRYGGKVVGPGSSEQDKAALLAELKKRVVIQDRGVPAEGARLNALLARMMDSPTGRELAAKFIKEDAKAVLAFEEIPNTRVFTIDGRKEFWTSGGHAETHKVPPEVHLNQAYMEAKAEDAPETLAHELFGHVLETKRAERFGVSNTLSYYQNDEANAGLIGWTVGAELGNKIDNGWAWIYMDNPDNYHKQLKMNLPYYAGTLTTEEMKAPLATYQKRLVEVNKLLQQLPTRKKRNEDWLKIIAHLIETHKMDESSFLTLKESIKASQDTLPGTEKDLLGIRGYLLYLINLISGEKGKELSASMARDSDNAYYKEMEQVLEKRRQVLSGLMLGKTQQSEAKPGRPGQVSWDQLSEMWKKDRESGECGWKP